MSQQAGRAGSDIEPNWNARGYDFNIGRYDRLVEKLDESHKNPITRGLVELAADCP